MDIRERDGSWHWERCWCGLGGHGFDSPDAAYRDYQRHLGQDHQADYCLLHNRRRDYAIGNGHLTCFTCFSI